VWYVRHYLESQLFLLRQSLILYQAGDPAPKAAPAATSTSSSSDSTGMGVGLYAFILLGGVAAYGAYQYLQTKQANKI